jgi:hypothetical protein
VASGSIRHSRLFVLQCRRLLGGSIVGRRHPVCLVQLPGATVEASSLQSNDRTSAAAGQHQPLDAAALTLLIHQTPSAAAAATGPHAGWTLPATWSYSQARRQDALRRDFTANALLYDPFSRLLFDYVGGWQDMQQRVVRCVGDPSSSFQADPSRMLRALRCASRAGEGTASMSTSCQNVLQLRSPVVPAPILVQVYGQQGGAYLTPRQQLSGCRCALLTAS